MFNKTLTQIETELQHLKLQQLNLSNQIAVLERQREQIISEDFGKQMKDVRKQSPITEIKFLKHG